MANPFIIPQRLTLQKFNEVVVVNFIPSFFSLKTKLEPVEFLYYLTIYRLQLPRKT